MELTSSLPYVPILLLSICIRKGMGTSKYVFLVFLDTVIHARILLLIYPWEKSYIRKIKEQCSRQLSTGTTKKAEGMTKRNRFLTQPVLGYP